MMECVGKKYLIQGDFPKAETKNGIYLPVFGTNREYESYIGKVIGYGTGFTQEEKKDLIPIGSKVIMDYSKNISKIRLYLSEKVYYIYDPENILAIITEED